MLPGQKHVQTTQHSSFTGTHYIANVGCESTLRHLRKVLTNRQEFCVHAPQYKPGQDFHQPESTPVFQCLSAGTNGEPKRIRRTHQSWIASFVVNAQMANITTTDSYAIIGNLSHSLALYAALEAAYIGADLHALADLRPDRQLSAMATLQSSILYATPTQLRLLCHHANKVNTSKLAIRHIFCGGGIIDQTTKQHINALFARATVQEFYGASETSFITISDKHTPIGSVGKAYPGVEIRIEHTGNPSINSTKAGTGQIWVRSPYLFKAYADTSAQGAQGAQCKNGFISVGEVGYMDKQGYLFLDGRLSRRVNIADTVVYPEQIEAALQEHPAVSQCAVIPIKDTQRGCILVAVVQSRGIDTLKQALLVHMRQRVGSLKAPRDIIFVSDMPLLASGKPDLMALEQLVTQQTHWPLST